MQVIYNGPYEQVEVPTLDITATRGEPVEVPDEAGKLLCAQEHWESANKSAGRSRKAEESN